GRAARAALVALRPREESAVRHGAPRTPRVARTPPVAPERRTVPRLFFSDPSAALWGSFGAARNPEPHDRWTGGKDRDDEADSSRDRDRWDGSAPARPGGTGPTGIERVRPVDAESHRAGAGSVRPVVHQPDHPAAGRASVDRKLRAGLGHQLGDHRGRAWG